MNGLGRARQIQIAVGAPNRRRAAIAYASVRGGSPLIDPTVQTGFSE